MFTLFHTVQLTLQIILFFIMLVIGHTVPAIYALGHNGVELAQNDIWISTIFHFTRRPMFSIIF